MQKVVWRSGLALYLVQEGIFFGYVLSFYMSRRNQVLFCLSTLKPRIGQGANFSFVDCPLIKDPISRLDSGS